ncbi:MAG: lysine--tRNA ligase [Chloroflexi bacterium]|nr:lysine--tRNA ligase [Chloroflexota bacterium]
MTGAREASQGSGPPPPPSPRKEDVSEQRRVKLQRLRALGLDPYPPRYRRTHTAQEAISLLERPEQGGAEPQDISVAGRIIARRAMGKAAFLDLRDGSGRIQAYLRADRLPPGQYDLLEALDLGDFLGVTGRLFRTKTGEPTIEAHHITLLAKSLQPLPEKWHGLSDVEKRYRQRYLDLASSPEVQQVFLIRSRLISALRRFLDGRGFLEVETPVLNPTAGGAAAQPFVTHHSALDRDLYLRIATELHLKRLIIGGLDRVYEIGRVFRNEGISTRHNPEFTTLESYEAYADYNDVMAMTEAMVAYAAQETLGKQTVEYNGQAIDFTPPWRRVTLREAIRERSGVDFEGYPDTASLAARMDALGLYAEPGAGRGKLIDKLLSHYVEPTLIQPTFLLDYPLDMSPLAKGKPGCPTLVERFEGFAGGMELANAFTELNDPEEQRERFRQQQALREAGDTEAEMPDEDFLLALEHGMPPTGGLGVGIDRLAMLFSGQTSIREVILFPQLKAP